MAESGIVCQSPQHGVVSRGYVGCKGLRSQLSGFQQLPTRPYVNRMSPIRGRVPVRKRHCPVCIWAVCAYACSVSEFILDHMYTYHTICTISYLQAIHLDTFHRSCQSYHTLMYLTVCLTVLEVLLALLLPLSPKQQEIRREEPTRLQYFGCHHI